MSVLSAHHLLVFRSSLPPREFVRPSFVYPSFIKMDNGNVQYPPTRSSLWNDSVTLPKGCNRPADCRRKGVHFCGLNLFGIGEVSQHWFRFLILNVVHSRAYLFSILFQVYLFTFSRCVCVYWHQLFAYWHKIGYLYCNSVCYASEIKWSTENEYI